MIKALSPYYINVPFVSPTTGLTCSKYTLKIFVWSGVKNTPPSTATYTITKHNPTYATGYDKINIARLVADFVQFAPQQSSTTGIISGVNQVWVKTTVQYTTTNPADNTALPFVTTAIMTRGYSYGMEGENAQPSGAFLIQAQEYKVDRNGVFNIPFLVDDNTAPASLVLVSVTNTTEDQYSYAFTTSIVDPGVSSQVRLIGATEWSTPLLFDDGTSPQLRIVSLGSSFETRIQAYDENSGTVITSNIITVTP